MKKSTLITTIAMIVVVVVALSTATYAWFSQATTSSVSDTIKTEAASDWVIMGATRSTSGSTDTVTYSSGSAIELTMLDGLYSPTATISAKPSSITNSGTFALTPFFNAKQTGNGQLETAMADVAASVDPIAETPTNNPTSAANYVRIINTKSVAQGLKLTITVHIAGELDANYYAGNAFCTYVGWRTGSEAGDVGSANTAYYPGTLSEGTTGEGAGYYTATRSALVAKSANLVYKQAIDAHNTGAQAIPSTNYVDASVEANNLTIGETTINSGKYYQIEIVISESVASNAAVNIAFYAWFDGWVLDNTGANSQATVYYQFGTYTAPVTP